MSSPRSSSPASKQISNFRDSLPAYFTKTNATIAHLNRLLSNTSTLDTTLLTTTYTLHLLTSLLAHFPPNLPSPRPALLLPRLRALTALLDESRILLRLPAVLSIYLWALATYASPPQHPIPKALAWTEILASAVFQALENVAFLGDKGVLRLSREARKGAWKWSSRAWAVYVGCELGRLGWEVGVGRRGGEKGEGSGGREKEEGDRTGEGKSEVGLPVEDKEWWTRWKSDLGVNLAYAPMTVHYSVDDGILGEGALGALGVVVAWLRFGEAWRRSN